MGKNFKTAAQNATQNAAQRAARGARDIGIRVLAELERFPPFAFLVRLQGELRTSYWFIPTVLVIVAILASLGTTYLDRRVPLADLPGKEWIFSNTADGARAVLSTIASSMITVAGVTFSVTIAAIAATASQFGPRLLTNFMQDRGKQWTLGTFLANFVYGLMVLRSVRSQELSADGFVPHISVLCAVVFALAGVAVLIYFLNHVPRSIHISNVIARLGHELVERIETVSASRRHPEVEEKTRAEVIASGGFGGRPVAVSAAASGYVQYVFDGVLAESGKDLDCLVVVAARPGDFVRPQTTLAYLYTGQGWSGDAASKAPECVREAFSVGDQRTQAQDPLFLVDTLAEIAARALSPGVNDHVTAMSCINWLSTGIDCTARQSARSESRRDEEGVIRVLIATTPFAEFCGRALEPLRPYVAADLNTTLAVIDTLSEVASGLASTEQRRHLMDRITRQAASARTQLSDPLDEAQLEAAVERASDRITDPPGQPRRADDERLWRTHAANSGA